MKFIFSLLAIVFVLPILWLIFIVPFTGLMYGYSDGDRAGDIYKFSKKGIFWKSWEGEMYLGGLHQNSQGNLEMEKFYFSIPESEEAKKKDLIEKLKHCAADRDKKCTISYKQWLFSPIEVSSQYIVYDVTIEE